MNDSDDSRTPDALTSHDAKINPYQPVFVDESEENQGSYRLASLRVTAIRWIFVCGISAIPSFVLGYFANEARVIGMLAGIAAFVVGYTMLDYLTSDKGWRSNKSIRRTLKVTYGTRIAISIIFPIGGTCDIYCGLATAFATQAIAGKQFTALVANETAAAFLATLIQGCTLNIVLAIYGLIVFGIVKVFEA